MNLYFLVEGTTEGLFYPLFIKYFFEGKLNRTEEYGLAKSNDYYLISCDGYPYIFRGSQKPDYNVTALKSAILEVNDNPVYDYLIVCLDTDESTIQERQAELDKYIQKYADEGVVLNEHCQLKLVAQNRCIETWFLGNRKVYSSNPNNDLPRGIVRRSEPKTLHCETRPSARVHSLRLWVRVGRLRVPIRKPDRSSVWLVRHRLSFASRMPFLPIPLLCCVMVLRLSSFN